MKRWQLAARGTAAAVAILASAVAAHGAGFQASEQTIVGLGRAFAGAGVVGDDLSAVFYNPAAMTLLEGTGVQVLPRTPAKVRSARGSPRRRRTAPVELGAAH